MKKKPPRFILSSVAPLLTFVLTAVGGSPLTWAADCEGGLNQERGDRQVLISTLHTYSSSTKRIKVAADGRLWLLGYGTAWDQWYEFPGRYHASSDGRLFTSAGAQVVGLRLAHHIEIDSSVRYYPDRDLAVDLVPGWSGLGFLDGKIYFDGEYVGKGYYVHRGNLYTAAGNRVTRVKRRSGGGFTVFYD